MSAAHRRMIRECWSVPKAKRTYPIPVLDGGPPGIDPVAIDMLASVLLTTMGIPRRLLGRP